MSSWDDDDSAAAAATDVELLKRAWRNEKAAPEILRFDSPLVSRVREQIQLLVRFSLSVFLLDRVPPLHPHPAALDLTGVPSPGVVSFQEETLDDFADSGVDDLVVSLYQMDLDRTLFLLRSYLRLRLRRLVVTSQPTPHVRSCAALPKLNQN